MFDLEANDLNREANLRKAIRLTAQIPTIITSYARLRNHLEPVKPEPSLGFAANFLYMLNAEEPSDLAAQALDRFDSASGS